MEDFLFETQEKRINKKKIIILVSAIILIILFIMIAFLYVNNKVARNWIDKNLLQKQKKQNSLHSIEIEEIENSNIYAFNKNIGILNKNSFDIYDNTGKKENTLTVEITKPIFSSSNRYVAIAEEKGQKLYLMADNNILWEKNIEGNISQITVNKNGFVAVTIVDTSYKTIVELYNYKGEHLFNTFLSSKRVVATTISDDNKYLALAEIDTSGTVIQSNIRIISIDAGKNDPDNSVVNNYSGNNNDLITNIKYQEKDKLLCMYTDKIVLIKSDGTFENLQEYTSKKVSFASIELSNCSITVEEKSSGLFTADSVVNIINSDSKNNSIYMVEAVTKEVYTSNNIIALNLGTEVDFINTSGWLVKKYMAEHEITSIVLSNYVAGIVYRDKIEIMNL